MTTMLREMAFYGLIATVVAASGLARVWVHQDAVQLGYQISNEEQRRTQLRETVHNLEVEWSAQRSPARLTHLAAQLGLAAPEPSQVMGVHGSTGAVSWNSRR